MPRLLLGTALALLAGPALAQAPICGGISLVGEWVGGDEAGSDVASAEAPFDTSGQVPIAGHLVRMFTLSEETALGITVSAVPAGDPYATLFDAAGAEVASDDDGGADYGARIEATVGPGTYCLAARSYESGVTDVDIRIGLVGDLPPPPDFVEPEFPPSMPDDLRDDPAVLPPSVPPSGNVAGCFTDGVAMLDDLSGGMPSGTAPAADVPAWGFVLDEPTALSVMATSLDGDPLIRVLDGEMRVLAENDDYDGLDSRIDLAEPLAPGEYCIEVEDLNGESADITVSLETFDPAADRLRRLNDAEFAPLGTDAVEITDLGALGASLLREVASSPDARWFRFEMPAAGILVAEAIGDGGDPVVTLFDRAGRFVGENDDGPEGVDSFLALRLLPGSYVMAVRIYGESASGAARLLMERYVPAD